MSVVLKFLSTGSIPGRGDPVTMRGGSLTAGRGEANDLVLPDPDRMLSKNHFVIEDHNGNVVVVDLSTNGTFLNYSKIPLGRTPTPLNSGDVLSLGGYEIVVEIAAAPDPGLLGPADMDAVSHGRAEAAPDPMALLDAPGPEGDFLDDLLGSEGPTGPSALKIPDPMDELLPPGGEGLDPILPEAAPEEPGWDSALLHGSSVQDSLGRSPASGGGANLIPDDWDEDPFAEPAPKAAPAPAPAPAPTPAAPPPPTETATPTPAPTLAPTAPPAGGPQAALAFVEALEVEGLQIATADLPDAMTRMGRVMRAMITGLREILMTRTSIKSEFRIDQTMIGAQGNNPLKFSVSPEQAIEALVKPRSRGYLDAEAAVSEALKDIKAHEVAMVSGMEAALRGVLARLDPEVLAGRIEAGGGLGSLFKGKKARYWEVYETMYAEIADQAENEFHDLFSREFARAYKEQLAKLK